ncbi:MAG: hypothetical protein HS126_12725 [Anaerolineales bacterium]|nr:hypothetical protein [Anaerolineales bacterium]
MSAGVQRRWGSWGIFILGLWALVLVLVALSRLILLSAIVASESDLNLSQGQVWTVFVLNGLFGLAFAASAYGLWTLRHWGRLLFMGSIIVWAIFYVVALFSSGELSAGSDYSPGSVVFNLVPYLVGLIVSVWYLNMPHIKALFDAKEAENEQNSE